jgi:stearoyl-CoA desaturase (delta-9 desaturase)
MTRTASPPAPPPPRRDAPDLDPVANPLVDRIASAVVSIVPFLCVFFAAFQLWNDALHWQDLVVFGVMYLFTGLGVTVGLHRLLTHRSFRTHPWLRGLFAIAGSMAVQGPVIEWVATHRRHHAFSDEDGDPHSPHGHGGGFRGALRGLWHAHLGWVFSEGDVASERRYAPDLLKDPVVRFVDSTFVLWVALTLAIPFGLGYALTGTMDGALSALVWGGAVRLFLLHHVTFAINSLCHFFGRRRFETGDESRNLAWLAPLSFGEAWHNNHHAFPTSARHGLGRRQFDFSAAVISGLERVGLAWDVVRISPERQAAKAAARA